MTHSENKLLHDYEQFVESTQQFSKHGDNANNYLIAGITSEVGEIAGVWKRTLRGDYNTHDFIFQARLLDELGDVLWYITSLSLENGSTLEDLIGRNMAKLSARLANNTIKGEGDDR
jgi:NTP pyrophosphatase (non-canonical NTP hydrolase)